MYYKLSILTKNNNEYTFQRNKFEKFYAKVEKLLKQDEIYRKAHFNNDSFLLGILGSICECETIIEQERNKIENKENQ